MNEKITKNIKTKKKIIIITQTKSLQTNQNMIFK